MNVGRNLFVRPQVTYGFRTGPGPAAKAENILMLLVEQKTDANIYER